MIKPEYFLLNIVLPLLLLFSSQSIAAAECDKANFIAILEWYPSFLVDKDYNPLNAGFIFTITKHLFQEAGIKMEIPDKRYLRHPFLRQTYEVKKGKIHMQVGVIYTGMEKEEGFYVTKPFMKIKNTFISHNTSAITNLDQIQGQLVGLPFGQDKIEKMLISNGARLLKIKVAEQAYNLFRIGRINLYWGEHTYLRAFSILYPSDNYAISDKSFDDTPVGILVSKKWPCGQEITDKLNKVISELDIDTFAQKHLDQYVVDMKKFLDQGVLKLPGYK